MSLNDPVVRGDEKIGDSNYSISWLLKALNLHDHKWTFGEDIRSLTALPRDVLISKDKGYASKIYSIRLTVGEHIHHVIAKLPSDFHMKQRLENLFNEGKLTKEQLETENRKNFEMISSIHNRELEFYRISNENFKDLHCPQFIHGEEMTEEQEGIILMEDFTDRCAKDISSFNGLSKNQVLPIVEDLARLQCQSLNIPNLKQRFPPINSLIQAVTRFSLMSANVLADRNLPWFTLDIAKEIFEIVQPDSMLELYSAQQEEFGMPSVLVHADLWPGNMLWEKNEGDEEAKMMAIIDWQNYHAGSFTTDLAVLLGVSMDGETRRKEEKTILEFFFEKLNEYKKLVHEAEINLTHDQVENSYRKSLRYAVLPMMMTVVTNPKDDEPQNGETEGKLTKRLKFLLEDVFGK
uniref:CHK kinase-like domain-containing protein n=1 Tax=Acrobeloides nanus TaxID=290746 RepID=A0A914CJB4_9BILA